MKILKTATLGANFNDSYKKKSVCSGQRQILRGRVKIETYKLKKFIDKLKFIYLFILCFISDKNNLKFTNESKMIYKLKIKFSIHICNTKTKQKY